MKTKVVRSAKYATLFLLLLLIGYSCSDDPVQQIDFNETQWEIINVNVAKGAWKWYEDTRRYESVVELPELTKFIYENGVQLGYVFIVENGVEKQIMLPHLFTYYEDVDNDGNPTIVYTENISCDFKLDLPSEATLSIQTSDLYPLDEKFVIERNFRIVLMY